MRKVVIILPLLLFFTLINVQSEDYYSYIINDPDGYLNIREKPTASSQIVDRIEQYEIFFDVRYFCGGDDEMPNNYYLSNWIPVCKEWGPLIGYVYKPNAIPIDSLPMLSWKENGRQIVNGNQIVCDNDTLQIVLTLKPFDISTHKITLYDNGGDPPYIIEVDGQQYPYGLIYRNPNDAKDNWEIASLTIFQNGQKKSLSIDNIKKYFNPNMLVYIGLNGDLYIHIWCGDGGEAYSICLSVVNGVICYAKSDERC